MDDMRPTIDEQLQAEAILKTERLKELIAELVWGQLELDLPTQLKQLLENHEFIASLYKWPLANAVMTETYASNIPDFELAVKSVMKRQMEKP